MEVKRRNGFIIFLSVTFRVLLVLAGLCLIVSYISSYIDPAHYWTPLFFGLYFIPILIVNFILLLIALILRSKSVWIAVIAILPALLFADRFYRFGSKRSDLIEGTPVKLETYNVGNFGLSKNGLDKDTAKAGVFAQIKEDDPDIVCLQEVTLNEFSQTASILPQYKYRTNYMFPNKGDVFGNIILSRYKIIGGGTIKFKHSTNLSIYADIVIDKDTIRVFNNHLESNSISLTSSIKKIRENKRNVDEVKGEILSVNHKIRDAVIRRSRQANALFNIIKKSPYPTVICGDFNDTPMSYTYYKLSYNRKDTFKESGKGFAATYSVLWPLLRIDYVFIPEKFEGLSHKTIKCDFSDHYPVVTEFTIIK